VKKGGFSPFFPSFFFSFPLFISFFSREKLFSLFDQKKKKSRANKKEKDPSSLSLQLLKLFLFPRRPKEKAQNFSCCWEISLFFACFASFTSFFFTRNAKVNSVLYSTTCCRLRRAFLRTPSRLVLLLLLADLEAIALLLLLLLILVVVARVHHLLLRTPRVVFFIGRDCAPVPRARRRHLHCLQLHLASGLARSRKTTI